MRLNSYASVIVRLSVLILLIILGLTAIFPQWLDLLSLMKSEHQERKETPIVLQTKKPVELVGLYGSISSETSYVVNMVYYATSDIRSCTHRNFDGGQSPDSRVVSFSPIIENNKHRIELPMDSISSNTACGWQPRYLEICLIRSNDSKHCFRLFDAKPNTAIHHPTGVMTKGQNMDGQTINIECEPFDLYSSNNGSGTCYLPKPYDEKFRRPEIMLEDRFHLSAQKVEVNFNFLTLEQVQQRDVIMQMVWEAKQLETQELRRQKEDDERRIQRELERRREAQAL